VPIATKVQRAQNCYSITRSTRTKNDSGIVIPGTFAVVRLTTSRNSSATKSGPKQANIAKGTPRTRIGDEWTFVALDPDSKLVPAYLVGKRTRENAVDFMFDLSNRHMWCNERAFGADVDYGQIVKFYDAEPTGPARYIPPQITHVERTVIAGSPDPVHISTSLVERQNLTMRMSMRRFTRLTNGFSKKLENLKAAVGLHFAHYNFVRLHKTLRTTPAMAAGISDRLWSLEELVEQTS
jgi:IS1 family transposase